VEKSAGDGVDQRLRQLVVGQRVDDREPGGLLVGQRLVGAVVDHRLLAHRRRARGDPPLLDHGQVDAQVVAVEADGEGVLEPGPAEDGDVVVVRVPPRPDRPAQEVGLVVAQHVLQLRDLRGLGERAQWQRGGEQVPHQDLLAP
jgi:hypothetical protein